jgi:cytochrome c556
LEILPMKPNRVLTRAALFAVILGSCGHAAAQSQFETVEDAVRYRQAAFTLIGEHMGRVGNELRAARPDPQKLRASADFIAALSTVPWEAFGADTATGKGSRARPTIWKERVRFDELAENMRADARKMSAAAGDVAALRAQFGNLAKTCKACHDGYKQK